MNKTNKKLLIVAMVAIMFGIVAIIPSVFATLPYVEQVVTQVRSEGKKELVQSLNEPVKEVVIHTENIDVKIVKSLTDNVEIYQTNSLIQKVNVDTKIVDGILTINSTSGWQFPEMIGNAQRFIEQVTAVIVNAEVPAVIVAVPDNTSIDTNIQTYSSVFVEDGSLLGAENTISAWNFGIESEQIPTSDRKLTYTPNNSHADLDYRTLNNFSDVVIDSYYVNLANYSRISSLKTQNVIVEADSVNIAYIPFEGTIQINEKGYGNGYVNIDMNRMPNIDWEIKVDEFVLSDDKYDDESGYNDDVHGDDGWDFSGYFWPETQVESGKMIITSSDLRFDVNGSIDAFKSFVKTQPTLQIIQSEMYYDTEDSDEEAIYGY